MSTFLRAREQVKQWNAANPIGTMVAYDDGGADGPRATKTRTSAFVKGKCIAVIGCENIAASVELKQLRVLTPEEFASMQPAPIATEGAE